MNLLEASGLWKTFPSRPPIEVLKGASLELKPGERLAIMGKSGEGKSTLLHILGTLEKPTQGSVKVCGIPVTGSDMASLRNQHIGFIFQSYHLLEDFSVLDNVCIPLRIGRTGTQDAKAIGRRLLEEVGLLSKANELAKHLSGGEKQRVAIARAMANNPSVLLADEPTGNLDEKSAQQIQELLLKTAKDKHKGLIVVTHDADFAKQCDRILVLREGQLFSSL